MDMRITVLIGSIAISILTIVGCIVSIYIAYKSSDLESAKLWQQTLMNAMMVVLTYWVGSAASSRLKDDTIANIKTAEAEKPPTEAPTPNFPKAR